MLEDRIAIVTGGAQGLGEAICHSLAREGAHLVVADINGTKAEQVAAKIEAATALANSTSWSLTPPS